MGRKGSVTKERRGGGLKIKCSPQHGPFVIISYTQRAPKLLPALKIGIGKYLS